MFSCKFVFAGYCAFVDAEHALDPTLAEAIGVKTDNLLLSQPDSGEQALSLVDTLIRSGAVDVVVVDSVSIANSFELYFPSFTFIIRYCISMSVVSTHTLNSAFTA